MANRFISMLWALGVDADSFGASAASPHEHPRVLPAVEALSLVTASHEPCGATELRTR